MMGFIYGSIAGSLFKRVLDFPAACSEHNSIWHNNVILSVLCEVHTVCFNPEVLTKCISQEEWSAKPTSCFEVNTSVVLRHSFFVTLFVCVIFSCHHLNIHLQALLSTNPDGDLCSSTPVLSSAVHSALKELMRHFLDKQSILTCKLSVWPGLSLPQFN